MNKSEDENFTPVFLAHARLYAFANMQLATPLIDMALQKLYRTLMDFTLYEDRVNDILDLARYAYYNESIPARKPDGTIDPLRLLIIEYMAVNINSLDESTEFAQMMEDGGEFVGDLWGLTKGHW
jgi:hypothetical protein